MLVKVTEAARELNLSIDHVRTKIRKGLWPVYKFGPKATRLDLEEIKNLARAEEKGAHKQQEQLGQ